MRISTVSVNKGKRKEDEKEFVEKPKDGGR